MIFLSLLLFISLPLSHSIIQLPFQGVGYSKGSGLEIYFNLSIGTPPQQFKFTLQDYGEYPGLYVKDKRVFKNKGFDPTKSSTFHEVGGSVNRGDADGVNATETFTFPNGIVLKNRPFEVINRSDTAFGDIYTTPASMGTTRYDLPNTGCTKNTTCVTFVESIVREQKEAILVMVFDEIKPNNVDTLSTGQLVFGERPTNLCASNWSYVPEEKFYVNQRQWTFNISGVSHGKFSRIKPGRAFFYITNKLLRVTWDVFQLILKSLNAGTDQRFKCEAATEDIVFKIGTGEVRVGPDVYSVVENEKTNTCKLNVDLVFGVDPMELPANSLSNKCLLFDYDKIQIGFADKTK